MYILDFRVSYSVTLFGFVDSLSLWDKFVSHHIQNYFNHHYVLSSEDKIRLDKYTEIRKISGWDSEIDLYNWAYTGDPIVINTEGIKDINKYFENRVAKDGRTLKAEITKATKQLHEIKPLISDKFIELPIGNLVTKLTSLFDSHLTKATIPCYLTYSPNINATQGGANGRGITVEVSTNAALSSQIQSAVEVIAHEYLHKAVNPGKYFQNFPIKATRATYGSIYPKLYPDKLYSFIEEVITYTLVDVYLFGKDAEGMRNYYHKNNDREMTPILHSVCDIKHILTDYLSEKSQENETINKLDIYFRSLARAS